MLRFPRDIIATGPNPRGATQHTAVDPNDAQIHAGGHSSRHFPPVPLPRAAATRPRPTPPADNCTQPRTHFHGHDLLCKRRSQNMKTPNRRLQCEPASAAPQQPASAAEVRRRECEDSSNHSPRTSPSEPRSPDDCPTGRTHGPTTPRQPHHHQPVDRVARRCRHMPVVAASSGHRSPPAPRERGGASRGATKTSKSLDGKVARQGL